MVKSGVSSTQHSQPFFSQPSQSPAFGFLSAGSDGYSEFASRCVSLKRLFHLKGFLCISGNQSHRSVICYDAKLLEQGCVLLCIFVEPGKKKIWAWWYDFATLVRIRGNLWITEISQGWRGVLAAGLCVSIVSGFSWASHSPNLLCRVKAEGYLGNYFLCLVFWPSWISFLVVQLDVSQTFKREAPRWRSLCVHGTRNITHK